MKNIQEGLKIDSSTSDNTRSTKIQSIRNLILDYNAMEKQWIAEEKAKGNDPDKDIVIRVVRMLIAVNCQWLASEIKLHELEIQFAKIIKAEAKGSIGKRNKS